MLAAPKWKRTRQVVTTNAIFVPLAIAYGYLLACSWQPDTFSLILPGSLKEGLSGQALSVSTPTARTARHTYVDKALLNKRTT